MSFNVTIKRSNLKQIINEVAKDIKIIKTRTSCGAALTQQLFEERMTAINSVDILSENNSRFDMFSQKVELIQLNEILYPYFLQNKSFRDDLYSRVVRQTINELRKQGLVDKNSVLLTEGFWDSIQSGIGSAAGGVDKFLKKIGLKKEPEGYEQAQRIFAKIAEKEGHKVVQDLIKAIQDEARDAEAKLKTAKGGQQFPVNKNRNIFFSGVNTIATTYDTIVAATKKDPGEEGYMPPDMANEIIEQLRIVVQKYMSDTEREKGGMYASFGGGDASEAEKLDEGEEDEPKAEEINPDEEFEKIMRGQDSPVFARMTSLKAPMVIAGTGAALGALGWVANQPWFHDFVIDVLEIPKEVTTPGSETVSTSEVMDRVESSYYESNPELKDLGKIEGGGGGLARQTSRLLGLDSGSDLLGRDASIADLRDAALKAGGGDLDQGLQNIASLTKGRGKPEEAFAWMSKAISDPSSVGVDSVDKEGGLWRLWAAGTDRGGGVASHAAGGVFSVGVGNSLNQIIMKQTLKTITRSVPRTVTTVAKTAGKTVGTAGAAKAVAMMTGAAPVLAGIGLATVVAGASLAAIRHRAKKKSRMGTLNILLQTLELVEDDGVIPPKPEEECPEGQEMVDGKCQDIKPKPDDECPPGQEMVDGECQDIEPVPEPDEKDAIKPYLVVLDSKTNRGTKKEQFHVFDATITSKEVGDERNEEFAGVQKSGFMSKLDPDETDFKDEEDVQQEAGVGEDADLEEKRTRARKTGTVDSGEFKFNKGDGKLTSTRLTYPTVITRRREATKRYGNMAKVPLYFVFDGTFLTKMKELRINDAKAKRLSTKLVDELHDKAIKTNYFKFTKREIIQHLSSLKFGKKGREKLIPVLAEFGIVADEKQEKAEIRDFERRRKIQAKKAAAAPEALQETKNRQILNRWRHLAGIKN